LIIIADVTIKDIAVAAGVSHPTVSKALNDAPGVNPETKRRILKLARQMNYVPNVAAKRLVNKKNRSFGFIWPKVEGLFFYHLCTALQKEALTRDIDVFVSMAEPAMALRNFNQHFIDFVLCWLFPNWIPSADFIKERERFKGEVTIIGGGRMDQCNTILIDRGKGVYDAVQYLAKIGHKRVAFVGEDTEKSQGYIKGMLKARMEYDPDYLITIVSTYYNGIEDSRKELYDKFTALWHSDHRPTALILDSQDSAFVMINILRDLDIQVPDDLSIICYDDIPELSIYPVPLTTCSPSISGIVDKVLTIYENFYEGKSSVKQPEEVILPELIVRESTVPG
jgi:LacI family transcriptional regulator